MKYYVDFGTGVGNFWCDTLEEAMERAEEEMCYTQCSVTIEDEHKEPIMYSPWWGTGATEDDEPLADFGEFGYYDQWQPVYYNN